MIIGKNIEISNENIESALLSGEAILQNFGLVFDKLEISATNGSIEQRMSCGNDAFLVRDIKITAYTNKNGNLFKGSNYAPDDKFTIQIKNGSSENLMFSNPIDIQQFGININANNSAFTPFILQPNVDINVRIAHDGKYNSGVDSSNMMELSPTNKAYFQVAFLGAKIKTYGRG